MWEDTLTRLRELDPSIGDITQLKGVSDEIKERMNRFVALGDGDDAVSFFASELTREHLREVVRFFVSTEPCAHALPFQRLGTGTINLLVFAFLTFIAELKEKQSVIFAMEEPEIALAPHTQSRVTRFVLGEMGQAIVTSHSPYVIEQFEPQDITILERTPNGDLSGQPIDIATLKPKVFSKERRQFAEAVLSRAVLVVEGATEGVVFPAASTVMEKSLGNAYLHFDLAGITVFDAGGDGNVPKYGPVFRRLGKPVFCFYDSPKTPITSAAMQQMQEYTGSWQSPEETIEKLLVKQVPVMRIRTFLEEVKTRADYPGGVAKIADGMNDDEVRKLAEKVLVARKGDACGYAGLLIECCTDPTELPHPIKVVLDTIQAHLSGTPPAVISESTD
jgi:putative ATP-dependent endonuclease of OLD family